MPGNPSKVNRLYPLTKDNDYILGGSEDDEIQLIGGTLIAAGKTGNRVIDGGYGADVLLPVSRSFFVLSTNSLGGTVVTGAGARPPSSGAEDIRGRLIATLYHISRIEFADGNQDLSGSAVKSVLWQNTSGQASIWEMNGNSLIGGGAISANPGPAWKAAGRGDFNKDGLSDILWQNSNTGQASIWEMNGNALLGGGPVSPSPGPSWKAIGTGDFSGDGFSDDILWQNPNSGQASIWEMSGNSLIGGGPVSPRPGLAWKAIGTGDFKGDDGRSWQEARTPVRSRSGR